MAATTTTSTDLSPFLKSLVSSDRPTRDAALTSLSTYLSTPSRTFTHLDLLKIWKSLFYTVFHTDRPLPQQRLCRSLASLLSNLPEDTFLLFVRAFWETMASQWSAIPGLRLDKYLLLCRCYVQEAFTYLAQRGWEDALVERYLGVLEEGVMSTGREGKGGQVPDGLRYHVLDVWIDGIEGQVEGMPEGRVMRPVDMLAREGKTKVLRERAKEVLADERLTEWMGEAKATNGKVDVLRGQGHGEDMGDEEWGGLDD